MKCKHFLLYNIFTNNKKLLELFNRLIQCFLVKSTIVDTIICVIKEWILKMNVSMQKKSNSKCSYSHANMKSEKTNPT